MKILLIEDDRWLNAALIQVLEANDYRIDLAEDGQVGLAQATAVEYDLILLDVQIPKLDGIHLCRQLRSQGYGNPILLLTTDDSDAGAIAGFDAGADDYISKPCAPEVLLAKIRTLLRRRGAIAGNTTAQVSGTALTWGKLCLDPNSGRVTVGEQVIAFTATEYHLLELFLRHPDRIFSRSAILDRLWGVEAASTDRAIVTHVKEVRKKLKAAGLTEDMIETIYGMGYRLKAAPQPIGSNLQPVQPVQPAQPAQPASPPQPSQPNPQTAIAKVLERFRGVFDAQVALLDQTKAALLAGTLAAELHQSARQEAHKLAGSLASFGYPEGSKLARSIEHLLIGDRPSLTTAEICRFSDLVTALQQELRKTPVTSTASSIAAVAAVQTARVLVIDDDAPLTERLKAESDAWGLRMKIAADPAAARSLLALAAPDVVLLDLSFPATEEDGLSLLQEMTQRSPDLPVIVFTGRDSLGDRLTVSRLGARQFLHKPATTEQIFQAITRVLAKPHPSDAKVLLVDDDPAMLAVLSTILTPWGLEVVTLSEPQHFWKILVATTPDLILLDLEMPQVSGLELCQVVRLDTQWGDLPILVVTAHTDATSLQQAFAAGADDFITKPVLGPELVTRVLSRIERHRLHRKTGHTGRSSNGGNGR